MKRNKTKLEENLISKGWSLAFKTYFGKHCDKVFQYVYEKCYVKEYKRPDGKVIVSTDLAQVLLDSKREHIDDVVIRVPSGMFDEIALAYWFGKVKDIQKEVDSCYPKVSEELSTEEVVECAEAIRNVE